LKSFFFEDFYKNLMSNLMSNLMVAVSAVVVAAVAVSAVVVAYKPQPLVIKIRQLSGVCPFISSPLWSFVKVIKGFFRRSTPR